MRAHKRVVLAVLLLSILQGASETIGRRKDQGWPSRMNRNVAVLEHSSTHIGTNRTFVVEVEKVPVFTFEQGVGNGFPQDAAHAPHLWLHPIYGYKPAMLNQEIALILSYLHPEATMLEWGSGGSTIFFSPKVQNYYSVEHNSKWAGLVGETCAKNGLKNVQIRHVQADNKRSMTGTREAEFASYCSAVHTFGVRHFDFVLIDGRARQFCAKAILPYVDQNSRIFVHDFPLRARYFSMFEDFFVVASVLENGAKEKGLVVLQPRRKSARRTTL